MVKQAHGCYLLNSRAILIALVLILCKIPCVELRVVVTDSLILLNKLDILCSKANFFVK